MRCAMRGFSLWLSIATLAGLVAGCYAPDLSSGRFACDSKDPVCPDGQRCVRGLCQGEDATPDGGGGSADLSSGAGGTPCRQAGGFVVGKRSGKDVYACPGTFGRGQASQQCQSGYSICDSATGIDLALCKSDGFFLSKLEGRSESGKVVCGDGGVFSDYLIGCGALSKGVTTTECGGFRAALDCPKDETFSCNTGISTVENKLAKNGVLCCP